MRTLAYIAVLALLWVTCPCTIGKAIQVTTEVEFKKEVISNKGVVFVEFYAPWCGHCQQLENEWEAAASSVEGIAKLVAVDATVATTLAHRYGVQGYPTIKVFGLDKTSPTAYEGARERNAIVKAVLDEINKVGRGHWPSFNFRSELRKTIPMVKAIGAKVGTITIPNGQDDNAKAFIEKYLAGQDVQGLLPKLLLFPTNPANLPIPYDGIMKHEEIAAFINSQFTSGLFGPSGTSVKQLTGKDIIDEYCAGNTICVLAVLPSLSESGSDTRRGYISDCNQALRMLAVQGRKCSFLWSEAGAQVDLETAFGLSFGFPALVALNVKKKAYSVHIGRFDTESIMSFAAGLGSMTSNTKKLTAFPEIVSVEKWEGGNAPKYEEPYTVEEVMGEMEGGVGTEL